MINDFPKMVYKAPGPHQIHGHNLDFATVNDDKDQAAALAAGWFLTTPEAVEAHEKAQAAAHAERVALANAALIAASRPANAPPTRAEMEIKAKELGITFNKNTPDAALLKAIDDKLAG